MKNEQINSRIIHYAADIEKLNLTFWLEFVPNEVTNVEKTYLSLINLISKLKCLSDSLFFSSSCNGDLKKNTIHRKSSILIHIAKFTLIHIAVIRSANSHDPIITQITQLR